MFIPENGISKVTAPQKSQPAPRKINKTVKTFSELRSEVLNLIGGANKKIWLTTNYLTDGEIVAALYVAKYRKIDVKVLLGARKSRQYMSRLNFLKKQKTPVYLKTNNFPKKWSTAMLIDHKLYTINSELDFKSRQSSFSIRMEKYSAARDFRTKFALAVGQSIPAIPRPIKQVGKGHLVSPKTKKSSTPNSEYNYDRSSRASRKAPTGVPTRLPRSTVYQNNQRTNVSSSLRNKSKAPKKRSRKNTFSKQNQGKKSAATKPKPAAKWIKPNQQSKTNKKSQESTDEWSTSNMDSLNTTRNPGNNNLDKNKHIGPPPIPEFQKEDI